MNEVFSHNFLQSFSLIFNKRKVNLIRRNIMQFDISISQGDFGVGYTAGTGVGEEVTSD